MRKTRREMGRRELKPTYLELPPLSKRLHLDQKKLSGAVRTRLLREKRRLAKLILIKGVISDLNRQLASVRGATGAGSGTSKRTRNSSGMPTSAEKQPKKRCRTLPELSYRDAVSNFKMAIIREKYPEDKLVEGGHQRHSK